MHRTRGIINLPQKFPKCRAVPQRQTDGQIQFSLARQPANWLPHRCGQRHVTGKHLLF
jgi:hypothetical protein